MNTSVTFATDLFRAYGDYALLLLLSLNSLLKTLYFSCQHYFIEIFFTYEEISNIGRQLLGVKPVWDQIVELIWHCTLSWCCRSYVHVVLARIILHGIVAMLMFELSLIYESLTMPVVQKKTSAMKFIVPFFFYWIGKNWALVKKCEEGYTGRG